MDESPLLVSSHWLHDQLKSPSGLILLDASWTFDGLGYDTYKEEHIPGAQHFDLNHAVIPTARCVRNLPEIGPLQEYVRSLGIYDDTHVVVYDFGAIFYSTKTWWTLKSNGVTNISVLEGGLVNWKASGFETETGPGATVNKPVGNITLKLDENLIARYDDVIDIVKNKSTQIIDCRESKHFHGQDPEPCPTIVNVYKGRSLPVPTAVQRGHILGAKNVYWQLLLDSDTKCFLPLGVLKKLYQNHNVNLNAPLVSTCYIGHTATLIIMTAQLCGQTNTRLYHGSWTEYSQTADAKMISTD